mmetsp:Transcript_1651/g.2608  ORF Transcript_1651/g.2608 Transcript_1651/m.2608 type:complete len:190 (+) Transcript_1651:2829-3398(+)
MGLRLLLLLLSLLLLLLKLLVLAKVELLLVTEETVAIESILVVTFDLISHLIFVELLIVDLFLAHSTVGRPRLSGTHRLTLFGLLLLLASLGLVGNLGCNGSHHTGGAIASGTHCRRHRRHAHHAATLHRALLLLFLRLLGVGALRCTRVGQLRHRHEACLSTVHLLPTVPSHGWLSCTIHRLTTVASH